MRILPKRRAKDRPPPPDNAGRVVARSWQRAMAQRGQAIVEFAVVATIFLTVVFGAIDLGRLFESWITVEHAAREGARYALTGRGDCDIATDDRLACIQYTAKQASTGLTGGSAAVTVSVRSWYFPDYANPAHEGSAGVACDSIEVEVDYDHHLITPLISSIISHVPIKGKDRVVNEPFGTCGQGH